MTTATATSRKVRWLPYRYPIVWHPADSKGRHLRFSRPKTAKLDPLTLREIRKIKNTLPCQLIPTGSPTQKQGAYELFVERGAASPMGA